MQVVGSFCSTKIFKKYAKSNPPWNVTQVSSSLNRSWLLNISSAKSASWIPFRAWSLNWIPESSKNFIASLLHWSFLQVFGVIKWWKVWQKKTEYESFKIIYLLFIECKVELKRTDLRVCAIFFSKRQSHLNYVQVLDILLYLLILWWCL